MERRHTLIHKLETILRVDIIWGRREQEPAVFNREQAAGTFIPVYNAWGLWVKEGALTSREADLLAFLIAEQEPERPFQTITTPKQQLLEWLRKVDREERLLPELSGFNGLSFGERVPFCVVTETQEPMREKHVKQVLESFFEGQVWVFKVTERKTFILPLTALIYEDSGTEEWRVTLWHWAEGLVELFASELGEDVRACVHPSVETIPQLGEAWLAIKRVLSLAETFHPRQAVAATWGMGLEKLLSRLPQEERKSFLKDIASDRHSWWRDNEMRELLEMFFQLNLNVSETARQMFLHRNTLIYRLDKLKQETGYDVRQFSDAIFIRLALLLTEEKL